MNDETKYPWQQPILEAFLASPEALPLKVNVAEKAIAARLVDARKPDLEEQLALNDGLQTLRVLLAEINASRKPPDGNEKKRDIA